MDDEANQEMLSEISSLAKEGAMMADDIHEAEVITKVEDLTADMTEEEKYIEEMRVKLFKERVMSNL